MQQVGPAEHPLNEGKRPAAGFTVLRLILGLLLLATAALKAGVPPLSQADETFPPFVRLLAIEAEAVLGVWLLSGLAPQLARRVALGVFTLLAGVAASLAFTGKTSCGCAGALPMSPWIAFSIDVTAVALLMRFSPQVGCHAGTKRTIAATYKAGEFDRLFVASILGAACLCAVAAVAGFGSLSLTGAVLRGDSITVSPADFRLGDAAEGEKRAAVFRLMNLTGEPVRVVGAQANCGCTGTHDLPVEIPPHDSREVRVEVTFLGDPPRFCRPVTFLTDSPDQPRLQVRVCGHALEVRDTRDQPH